MRKSISVYNSWYWNWIAWTSLERRLRERKNSFQWPSNVRIACEWHSSHKAMHHSSRTEHFFLEQNSGGNQSQVLSICDTHWRCTTDALAMYCHKNSIGNTGLLWSLVPIVLHWSTLVCIDRCERHIGSYFQTNGQMRPNFVCLSDQAIGLSKGMSTTAQCPGRFKISPYLLCSIGRSLVAQYVFWRLWTCNVKNWQNVLVFQQWDIRCFGLRWLWRTIGTIGTIGSKHWSLGSYI